MTAQLVRQDDGSYEYVEVDTQSKKTVAPNLTDFEAYEGAKKGGEELASAPNIGEQTQKVIRETPGLSRTEFDESTGQFETKSNVAGKEIDYTPGAITPESTEQTSLEKVMSMQPRAGTQDAGLNKAYKLIERQQKINQQTQQLENLYKGADLAIRGFNAYTDFTNIGKKAAEKAASNFATPLKWKGATPIGQSTLGGVGMAGVAGYGVSGLIGGDKKQQTGAGVGSAIGMAAAGPVGGVVGGVIGHVLGCFSPETQITMGDNTTKPIIDIDLKDNIAVGGFVFALGKFLINDLYDYKGIKVSGTHMVNEDGIWKEVKDTKHGKSLGSDEYIVYTLGTDKRRILINNTLFTDYFEVDEKDKLREVGDNYFDNWRDHVVILSDKNKKILNAS